jgi:hypothetical protein
LPDWSFVVSVSSGRPRIVVAAVLACLALAGLRLGAATFTARPPLAITSCGQSPDALTVSLLSRRMRLDHLFETSLKPERLPGIKTLVVVIGASTKGLFEAGTDETRESARVATLLAKARELNVLVIAVHVGGESRRGALSDRFIDLVVSQADYLIVTEAGNRDGLFTKVSKSREIPLVIVSQSAEVGRELRTLFPAR